MAEVQIDDLNIHDSNEKLVFDSIDEYEDSNIKEEGQKKASFILRLVVVLCGLFIISLLLSISDRLKNFYAPLGYISLALFTILFILYYVRPIIKFCKMDYFEVNRSKDNKVIKAHNIEVRKSVAKKIIDFQSTVKNAGWYDKEYVIRLNDAIKLNDNDLVQKYLMLLMNGSVKEASNKIIVNSAVQSGIYAAVSQSPQLDALLVLSVNFKMIKDLIFLYGFRPTEPKLIKIAISVLISSLAAYKINTSQIGAFLTAKFTAKSIPLVANGTAFLADAVIQAITNGTITMWVGYKTLSYLMKEYKLATLYDNIDILDDSSEFENTRKQINDKITKKVPFIKMQLDKMNENVEKEVSDIEKISEVIMPVAARHFIGIPFIEAQKTLLKLGFSLDKISFKSELKNKKGLFKKDGVVTNITFDGKTDVEKGSKVSTNSNIEITYVTYL